MTTPGFPTAEVPSSGIGFDIYQQLLKERIVFLGQQVDDKIANALCAQMLYLAGQDPDRDIWLYINSPGGSVTAGMAIYDTMQFIKPDVSTMCVGQAASMGSLLLTAGAHGKRYALPNSRIMIHQPLGGFQGQASDFAIHAQEILKIKDKLNQVLALHSGQPIERVVQDTDRDNFMGSEEARAYGLIDQVLQKRP